MPKLGEGVAAAPVQLGVEARKAVQQNRRTLHSPRIEGKQSVRLPGVALLWGVAEGGTTPIRCSRRGRNNTLRLFWVSSISAARRIGKTGTADSRLAVRTVRDRTALIWCRSPTWSGRLKDNGAADARRLTVGIRLTKAQRASPLAVIRATPMTL